MRLRLPAILVALLLAPPAAAQDNGGGTSPSAPPVVRKLICRKGCGPDGQAGFGSVVRIRGPWMDGVRWVVFLGGPGPRDDVVAVALRGGVRWVDVRVPPGAPAGRVRVRKLDGTPSRPSVATIALSGAAAPEEVAIGADGDTSDAIDAAVETPTVFFAGPQDATLRYVVTAPEPVTVAVELVKAGGGAVARWTPGSVAPGAEQRVQWNGMVVGATAPPGRYSFRVAPEGASAAVVDSFRFLDHKFPVRGPHDFGGAGSRFGAPRAGHVHQGQDVAAACGTELVAARGGTVVFEAWQAKAGNYVVIRGDGSGADYVYMHMAAPTPLARGARVRTGATIGAVGDTGDAHGCHLHFELWSPPGWYEGGSPLNPLAQLQAWDAVS